MPFTSVLSKKQKQQLKKQLQIGKSSYRTRSRGSFSNWSMYIFYWNARDFVNADTKIALQNFYLSQKPDVIFWLSLWLILHKFLPSIFREGNCCADLVANMGHSHQGIVWLSVLPQALQADFFRNRCGMPNYRLLRRLFLFVSVYFYSLFLSLRVLA